MKDKVQKRIDPFVLVIDKDRERVLNIMMQAVARNGEFIEKFRRNGLLADLVSLVEEVNTKLHERGWCEDVDCTFDYDSLKK